mgnify:FL=1
MTSPPNPTNPSTVNPPSGREPTDLQKSADKKATISLVLGLASFFCACLTGFPALIVGNMAYKHASPAGKTRATIGMGLGALIGMVSLFLFFLAIASGMKEAGKKQAGSAAAGPGNQPTVAAPAPPSPPRPRPAPAPAPEPVKPRRGLAVSDLFGGPHNTKVQVTLEQFNRIRNGMTWPQVKAIIGGDCKVEVEGGDPGTQFHTISYACDGHGSMGSNCSFMFQGGKLVMKGQFGLE